jgi:hypothetical protein
MAGFTKLSDVLEESSGILYFECPGCDMLHGVNVSRDSGPKWSWNGVADKPTFSPSVLVQYPWRMLDNGEREQVVCHSFVRDGNIEFLSDCTHRFAGQTSPMVKIKD